MLPASGLLERNLLRPGKAAAMVHLITILYNSEAGLPLFLDSLQAQDWHDWRLYVVDNASPDASADLVSARADPRFILLRNRTNLGFAKAANQGLRAAAEAGGEFFILINNDTAFAPDFLRRLLAVRSRCGAGVLAPRIMRLEGPNLCCYAGGSFSDGKVFRSVNHTDHDPAAGLAMRRVDFAPGCCLGISRCVLAKAGLFDESFFMYWEDTDFCMRLKKLGIPILYVSEPSLLHTGGASSGGEFSPEYMRLFYRSYAQLLRKHFGWRRSFEMMIRLLWYEVNRPIGLYRILIVIWAMLLGLTAALVPLPAFIAPATTARVS